MAKSRFDNFKKGNDSSKPQDPGNLDWTQVRSGPLKYNDISKWDKQIAASLAANKNLNWMCGRCSYFRLYIQTLIDRTHRLRFGLLISSLKQANGYQPPLWSMQEIEQHYHYIFTNFEDAGWFCVDKFNPVEIENVVDRVKRKILYAAGAPLPIPKQVVLTFWSVRGPAFGQTQRMIEQVHGVLGNHTINQIDGANVALPRSQTFNSSNWAAALVQQKVRIPLLGLHDRPRRSSPFAKKVVSRGNPPGGAPERATPSSLLSSRNAWTIPNRRANQRPGHSSSSAQCASQGLWVGWKEDIRKTQRDFDHSRRIEDSQGADNAQGTSTTQAIENRHNMSFLRLPPPTLPVSSQSPSSLLAASTSSTSPVPALPTITHNPWAPIASSAPSSRPDWTGPEADLWIVGLGMPQPYIPALPRRVCKEPAKKPVSRFFENGKPKFKWPSKGRDESS